MISLQNDLLGLSERYELHDADRIAAMSELAQLRGVSLVALMALLDIAPRELPDQRIVD
jgi:hypothetical protein